MQKYSKKLLDIFYNTQFSGAISGADVIVKNQDEENGEIVKVYLVVRNNCLQDCSFQAKGSIVLYASLTTICSLAKGKMLTEILSLSERDVINELKQLNKQEYREVVFALDSFKKAITTYVRRKAEGTITEKNNLRTKNIQPSKNITRYESIAKPSEIEKALSQKDETEDKAVGEVIKKRTPKVKAQKVEKVVAKEQNIVQPEINKFDKNVQKLDALINEVKLEQPAKSEKSYESEENPELMIVPVGGKKKQRKPEKNNVVIPTKIEVRVLDEDENKAQTKKVVKTTSVTTTTKTVAKENPYLIPSEPEKTTDDEVIDEIDSITEQLTNAISQLNFKFDDDDKN